MEEERKVSWKNHCIPYTYICTCSSVVFHKSRDVAGFCTSYTMSVHIYTCTSSHNRALSDAMQGPESDLGILALKAPSNSPTLSGSPSKRGRRRRRRRGERGSGGVMTTDDLLNDTSVELVCEHLHT